MEQPGKQCGALDPIVIGGPLNPALVEPE
jgi:hypothetical protein